MILYQFSTIKIEEKAVFLYRRFRNITSIARTLEFFFAAVFLSQSISRSSAYLPAAVELCRIFARRLCVLFVSHHFIFLLGNLIAITLLVKFGQSASDNRSGSSDAVNSGDDEEFLIGQFVSPPYDVVAEEMLLDEKRLIPTDPDRKTEVSSEEFESDVRSETEPDRKTESSGVQSKGRRRMQVEDLSNDEFQRKVEAFIERQQRFLREESLSAMKSHKCSA